MKNSTMPTKKKAMTRLDLPRRIHSAVPVARRVVRLYVALASTRRRAQLVPALAHRQRAAAARRHLSNARH